jgi:putative hydroxymethylpyrimidine transport system permease protein
MRRLRHIAITTLVLLGGWQGAVWLTGVEAYILPGPWPVLLSWLTNFEELVGHAGVTTLEILLGLALGSLLGVGTALAIGASRVTRRWLLPLLVISQAIPVFAIAPLLLLWLGYGIGSKVAMATLIIFFPVTASFLDGLRRTESGWLDLARTMTAGRQHARLSEFLHIRIPAALPALASGLRVAAATAPIGAVVGEWVGSSAGLGYLMLHANARVQIDLMFAALLTLALISLALYFSVDAAMRRLVPWQEQTHETSVAD